ncbi:hypothetical protein PF010_g29711 [Phytophthora fragariae]|uniref:RxLR effector protein n=1 Tax=Phytophthora fragariae TaxID=53985 RepID=A0A6G0MFQ9_9STRA|nr:hypothetical protein PF010_g29711 [Phytophthora fragariae]KAE9165606.1 hypothetical protein PF004_g29440 [Phytophthora fragariae]
MLAVLLSSMTAAAMLVMLLSLSPLPLPLRSPCRCGRAHRNAARRSPVLPPCSPSRRAAVAVPAPAMPAVLLSLSPLPLRSPCRCGPRNAARRSLCPPPPCSSCCSRCPRYLSPWRPVQAPTVRTWDSSLLMISPPLSGTRQSKYVTRLGVGP